MTSDSTPGGYGPVLPRHVVLLFTLAMLWGTSFLVIKIGVGHMPALTLTALRLATAAAVMVALVLAVRTPLPNGVRAWSFCFALAFFGNSLPFFLISWGEEGIQSGLAAILMAVMPLTTLVLAHFLTEGDRLKPQKLVGVALGFGGVVVLVGQAALEGLGGALLHQLAVAGGAICYAVSVIILKRMPPTPVVGRATLVLIFSVLQTAPAALYFAGGVMPPFSFEALWPAIYLGVFPTAVATLVLFKLASEREPSFIAFQNYLVPVFGVAWGAMLLDEVLSLKAIIALGLILFGIFIANRRKVA